MHRNIQLTTGFMAALFMAAVIAPGAPLHGKKQERTVPPTTLVAKGHALFVTNCSPCHGADAQGDDGPNLHHKGLPDLFIAASIKTGFKGEMPPFAVKLKALEVKVLVAYVHSLQK